MSTTQAWTKFCSHSLATRLDTETFESYVQLLAAKHPLSPAHISDLFFRPIETNNASLDPRIPRYVQAMLALELVTVPSVLRAMHRYSTFGIQAETSQENDDAEKEGSEEKVREKGTGVVKKKWTRWTHSYSTDEMLFYRMAKYITSGSAPRNIQQAVELILVCIQWMELVITASNAQQEILNLGVHGNAEEISATTMALGTLLAAVIDNVLIIRALSKGSAPKGTGKQLSQTLSNFVPLLLQSSPQSAARLELFRTQTMVDIEPIDKKAIEANKEIDAILDEGMGIDSVAVADLPALNSRAGLYVYLNSLVSRLVPMGNFADTV
jgi:mediator of RNA polymerase II transcription subunit 5